MTEKKKKGFKIPWRGVISVATFALVGYVIYQNWDGFVETFENLNRANILIILLLIPEQLFMYYACGQIFFSYLESKYHKNFGWGKKLRISTELNFVNRAVPAGSLGGLAYITYRLKPFGVTAGQASFLYIFRFAITTVVNYVQALVAILILLAISGIPEEANWVIWVSLLMNAGVFIVLGLVIYIASSKKRIEWFGNIVERFLTFVARTVTFGYKKRFLKRKQVQEYFLGIHECVLTARNDKKSLIRPTIWGFIYSLCEIGVYYIVACAMGRPDIMPIIMVGEAIGSVFDGIVPYGPYELGMSGVMSLLLGGSEEAVALSLIVVVMARALSLMFTIFTGWLPYQRVIGKKGE